MIDIKNLSYSIGGRTLLENISIYIPSGSKVGIVGANGCGKSTLFRLIQREIFPEMGEIFLPKDEKLVSVRQEIKNPSEKLLNFIISADEQLVRLRHLSETEEDGEKLGAIFEQLEQIDGFNAEIRATVILSGLGFSTEDLNRPLKELSGGWQIRAALAATLFAPSDTLLLDEPTNHLDFETSLWLKKYLKKLDKTLLIISHDRDILNTLCDKILHLPSGKLYTGNYDTFIVTRTEQQEALKKNIQKQEANRKHLQSFIDRFRYKASKAKQAQSRIKMLEKMQALPKLDRDYTVKFDFPSPKPIDRQLITIKNATIGYNNELEGGNCDEDTKLNDKPKGRCVVLKNVNLKIDAGDRIALLGSNGNGKSTLVKVLSGRLPLLDGSIEFAKKINIAYFSQQQSDELNFQKTPYEVLSETLKDAKEPQVRAQLARFGLTQQKSDTKIEKLSGGEKTRLLLAIATREAPHILILDEPTNHLDIEAKEALVEALNAYDGAIVLVSHDFYVVEAVCDQLLLVKDHVCRFFNETLDDYVNLVLADKKEEKKANKKSSPTDQKTVKFSQKEKEKLLQNLKKVEQQMEFLEISKKQKEDNLNTEYSAAILEELEKINQEISALEEQWVLISERLQQMDPEQ